MIVGDCQIFAITWPSTHSSSFRRVTSSPSKVTVTCSRMAKSWGSRKVSRAAIAHGKSIAEQTQPPALALEGPRFERVRSLRRHRRAAGLPGQLHDGVVDDGRALAEFLVGEVGGSSTTPVVGSTTDRALPRSPVDSSRVPSPSASSPWVRRGRRETDPAPPRPTAQEHWGRACRAASAIAALPRPVGRCLVEGRARCRLTHGRRRRRQARG